MNKIKVIAVSKKLSTLKKRFKNRDDVIISSGPVVIRGKVVQGAAANKIIECKKGKRR